MSEIKDNLLQLDKVVGDLNKRLDENIDKIDKLAVVYNKFSKESSTAPSQYVTVLNDTKKAVDNVTISSKKLEQQSIKESNARNALNKQREQSIAQLAKEEAKLQSASNTYNKLQVELNKLSNTYKDLATRKAQGATLTKAEAEQMTYLEKRIKQHDTTLKAVDATMGKYQRNVGNYAGAFNPLSNSINQLSREMPAFANSVQTGFMAISNNLPIFFDAMGGIIAQNKELQKQGQPTKSVLSQLAGAFFSWGTALSVGVTLLTLYGKDIVEFASNLMKGSKAIDSIKESQKAMNDISVQSRKNTAEEITNMKLLVGVAKDTSLSYKERVIAVNELQSTYPAYFGNLSKEKILAGETANAELELTNAILSRAKANAAVSKITENQSKIIDLELEALEKEKQVIKLREEVKSKQKIQKNVVGGGTFAGTYDLNTTAINRLAWATSDLNKINAEKDALTKINNTLTTFALENEKKSILLKDKNTKGVKEKIDLNFKEIQSIYELNKAKLESQKVDIQTNLDNENITLENKIKLRQDLSKKLIELANLDAKYEKDISEQKYLEDIQQNALALQNKEISTAQYQKNINDISKRYSNEQKKISVSVSDKLKEIYNNDLKYYGDIQEKELEKKRKTEAEKKEFTEKYNELIKEGEIEKYKKIAETETNTLEVRQEAFRKYKQLAIEELQFKKIQAVGNAIVANKTDEEIKFIEKGYDNLIAKLQGAISPLEQFQKQAEASNKAFVKGFQTDFMSEAGFSKLQYLIENFNTLKESGVATALAISEAFQEAFNTIANASQANFDAEYSRLEQQKTVSMQFAGESTAAKEEIEKEYERRKKEIQRREAEAQKRLAIFNIGINTAQAIAATFSKAGFPAGIPMAALMAAIGAAQIAMVSAQQIPQFWKGTDNAPEGLAWTQEKGAEVITDSKGNVKTYGNNKGAQLTYLNKGDKVYKSHTDYINKELSKNGIQQMGQSFSNVNVTSGLTAEDLHAGIESLKRTISSKENINIQIDKSGFKTAINGKQYLNNRLILKGRSV
jgi:hypothetical protein